MTDYERALQGMITLDGKTYYDAEQRYMDVYVWFEDNKDIIKWALEQYK